MEGHKIFLQQVFPNYDGCTLVYCSRHVQQMVYERVEFNNRTGMLKFLRVPKNSWQEVAHCLLATGGKFKIRELSNDRVNEVTEIRLEKMDVVMFRDVAEVGSSPGKFLVPTSPILIH